MGNRITVAPGRDAADGALASTHGKMELKSMTVTVAADAICVEGRGPSRPWHSAPVWHWASRLRQDSEPRRDAQCHFLLWEARRA